MKSSKIENFIVYNNPIFEKEALVEFLGSNFSQVLVAESYNQVFEAAKTGKYQMLITDIKIPGIGYLEYLKQIRRVSPDLIVLVATTYGYEMNALEASQENLYDWLLLPFNLEELKYAIFKSDSAAGLTGRETNETGGYQNLNSKFSSLDHYDNIVGRSTRMQHIYALIDNIADKDISVLIGGESGTGKELVVQAIHNHSPRCNKNFVKVNCAAIPDNLIESELFGHEKGAFTGALERKIGKFEIADGGTIFLDEIGDMTFSTQAKVLRVLQEQEFERIGGTKTIKVNVRVVSATHRDLESEIRQNHFREDLFYRLNVVSILLPPLRERREDIILLADHFLEKYNKKFGKQIAGFNLGVMRSLLEYSWPGNVRELQNVIESAVALESTDTISEMSLPYKITVELQDEKIERRQVSKNEEFGSESSKLQPPDLAVQPIPELVDELLERKLSLNSLEKIMIERALIKSSGSQIEAARILNLGKGAIQYKIKKHGIEFNNNLLG